jgi:hypothetical protein
MKGVLKFCYILKLSATVQRKLLKGSVESVVRYDSVCMKVQGHIQNLYPPWP